ncbi:MAG: N-acetylmuramoyl-L-alanine amidase [Alphaproteobacteria bacterium HGW-Alphaproteobacteria-12]|nr:MAG: N-acetylmuramoyl-L-alanine amidase [Alphaproteobacteria bacterium HGW-Alphaproteobacteria-12]
MGFHRKIARGMAAGFGLVLAACLFAGFPALPVSADDLADLLERELREASLPQEEASLQQENDALSTGAIGEGTAVPLAPSALAPAEGGPAVTSIRIGDHGEQTRFVMEFSGDVPADYRVFTLSDPFRVVIDVKNVPFRLVEEPADKHKGFVSGYRYGRFEADTYRVVLDAMQPVEISRDFVLDPQAGFGRRIVLDLAATDLANFNEKAGAPASAGPAASAAIAAVPVSPPAERLDRRRVVVIDAGHGGVDPGTHGRSGVQEKAVVLAFAKQLAGELRASGRYDVHLTRDSDIFIPLRERVAIARRHKADLFISIHADAIQKANVRGMSIYTLSENASDAEAAALARKENQSDLIAGLDLQGESPEVTGILIDLAQRETKNYSSRFAKTVVDHASQKTATLDPAHRFAGFVVLKAPDVPSVLIELGFLTNPDDEKQLTSPAWRATMAKTLSRSVDRYFGDRLAEGPN